MRYWKTGTEVEGGGREERDHIRSNLGMLSGQIWNLIANSGACVCACVYVSVAQSTARGLSPHLGGGVLGKDEAARPRSGMWLCDWWCLACKTKCLITFNKTEISLIHVWSSTINYFRTVYVIQTHADNNTHAQPPRATIRQLLATGRSSITDDSIVELSQSSQVESYYTNEGVIVITREYDESECGLTQHSDHGQGMQHEKGVKCTQGSHRFWKIWKSFGILKTQFQALEKYGI